MAFGIGFGVLTPRQKLSTARYAACRKFPYFSNGLLSLIEYETTAVPAMAVTDTAILMVNPEWLRETSVEHIAGVLVHEFMHVLGEHGKRAVSVGAAMYGPDGSSIITPQSKEGKERARLWNIATDCEINDDLYEAGMTLPDVVIRDEEGKVKETLTPDLPKKYGLQNGRTAEEYYGELLKRQNDQGQGQGQSPGQGPQTPDGNNANAPGAGGCGSGAGNPMENEPDSQERKDQGRSQAEQSRMRKDTAEAVKAAAQKGRGNMPAGWKVWAEKTLEPPRIRWQDQLNRATRRAREWKMGQVEHCMDRPSRRVAGMMGADWSGKPILPRMRQPVPRVSVVIDTSGSMMGDKVLTNCVREVGGILKAVGGEAEFVACDAQVHGGVNVVRRVEDVIPLLKGGGGTDFRPAFKAVIDDRPNAKRPDILIFITDGMGMPPELPPKNTRVIWVLIGDWKSSEYLKWGDIIDVDERDRQELREAA